MTLTAWRAVHPDLRSSRGFRWPWPGNEAGRIPIESVVTVGAVA